MPQGSSVYPVSAYPDLSGNPALTDKFGLEDSDGSVKKTTLQKLKNLFNVNDTGLDWQSPITASTQASTLASAENGYAYEVSANTNLGISVSLYDGEVVLCNLTVPNGTTLTSSNFYTYFYVFTSNNIRAGATTITSASNSDTLIVFDGNTKQEITVENFNKSTGKLTITRNDAYQKILSWNGMKVPTGANAVWNYWNDDGSCSQSIGNNRGYSQSDLRWRITDGAASANETPVFTTDQNVKMPYKGGVFSIVMDVAHVNGNGGEIDFTIDCELSDQYHLKFSRVSNLNRVGVYFGSSVITNIDIETDGYDEGKYHWIFRYIRSGSSSATWEISIWDGSSIKLIGVSNDLTLRTKSTTLDTKFLTTVTNTTTNSSRVDIYAFEISAFNMALETPIAISDVENLQSNYKRAKLLNDTLLTSEVQYLGNDPATSSNLSNCTFNSGYSDGAVDGRRFKLFANGDIGTKDFVLNVNRSYLNYRTLTNWSIYFGKNNGKSILTINLIEGGITTGLSPNYYDVRIFYNLVSRGFTLRMPSNTPYTGIVSKDYIEYDKDNFISLERNYEEVILWINGVAAITKVFSSLPTLATTSNTYIWTYGTASSTYNGSAYINSIRHSSN